MTDAAKLDQREDLDEEEFPHGSLKRQVKVNELHHAEQPTAAEIRARQAEAAQAENARAEREDAERREFEAWRAQRVSNAGTSEVPEEVWRGR